MVTASAEAPVLDATVGVVGETRRNGTTTNVDGRFVLDDLPPGTTTLRIRHVGYVSTTRTVEVQAGETARLTVQLKSAVLELPGLQITGATRADRATLPGAASTVRAAELEQMNPIGAQEAIASEPGVYGFADDGMGQTRMSISIRGLQSRRTQRVLVMEDGMPIQPAPYVFSPLYYNPPVERIEKVEVIKGSSTIRHGPQTMAGVINYVTSRPQRRSLGGTIKVTGGMHRYASTFAEIGGFGTDEWHPQVQVLFKRGDGFRENNDFRQINGTAKLQYDNGADRSLYVKSNVDYERMNATYTGLTPHTLKHDPNFNPKDDDLYRIFRASLSAIYDRQYSDSVQGTTKLYANTFNRPWWRENNVFVRAEDYHQNGAAAEPVPPTTPGPLVRVGVTDVTDRDSAVGFGNERTFYVGGIEHSFDINHTLFGHSADLTVGGRVHWERFEDNRKISDDPEAREGVFYRGDVSAEEPVKIVGKSHVYETTALALYGRDEIQMGRLRLSPGLRLEIFEQSRIDRLNGNQYRAQTNVVPLPGLGFNLDLGRYGLGAPLGDGQFNLFGGVHRGYTPPSSATFAIVGFAPPTAASQTDEAFDLKAEKSWNTELGLRGRSSASQFQLTGFYTYVEDLVGGRTSFQQNLGVVQSYGLEFQSKIKGGALAGSLPTLDVSYTFLRTEVVEGVVTSAIDGTPTDISGNELLRAPNHTATVGLSKTFSDIGLTLRGDLRYKGEFYTDLENLEQTSNRGEVGPVPSHTVVDAGVTYTYSDDLRFNLTVQNVTDNVYIGSRLHSNPRDKSAGGSTGILPGPRRQINLSVQYDF
ncbi:MAG: TonB-dependent receptor domain-containing protein [Salinibacter sp.]